MARRVLVVDDSTTVRRVAQRALADAGFEVVLAADGREGFEAAGRTSPDLVIVDFVMPHMNGFQMCQALRGIANLAHVPIVLMSAKADRIGEGFLSQTGAVDAITKPFSPEALLAVATHALAKAAHATAALVETAHWSPTDRGEPEARPAARDTMEIVSEGDEARELQNAANARRVADKIATVAADALSDGGVDAGQLADRIVTAASPESLLALAGEIADLVPALRGETSFEGRVDHVPLGDVLQLLQHQRQTGVLEVHHGERLVAVCMSNGSIDLALGRQPDEEFRLGRYLLEEELIDPEELSRLAGTKQMPRTLLGTRLVKMGYLSPEDLQRVLVRQTSELVYEALRWRNGTYRFVRLATRPEASQARLGLPIGTILMEGLRRVDEWRLIEEQIRSWDDVLRPDREALGTVDLDRFSREERTVLAAVDGTRTVREIARHAKMGSFEVSKILFQLLTSRLILRVP
jgi:DNA-binding response OmpR family regulator